MARRFYVVIVLLLVAGCSQNSFVGSRLGNFTAYYNTFYNAEKAYEDGVKNLDTRSQDQPIDQNVYLPLFGSEERPAQTQPFDDAIKKSSDILRDHPTSKWVDDALLLIGKSYFYLQNHVGAEEKFGEVMTLESPLVDEARFWLARTYIASAQYDAAANHLQESLIREDLSGRWEPQLRLALGSLYVKREDWDAAVTELETGLENVRDNDLAARAQFLLGQVYETLERYEEAVVAYERVSRFNPLYQQSYAAQFSAVRVEGLHVDSEDALRRLRRMERDDKNYENRAELAYLRGRIYQAAGRPEDALDTYYTLLYDSDANIQTVRGRTHYALGEFYRDVYEDYPLAAAHFDTASTGLRSTSSTGAGRGASTVQQEAFAPAAITDAVDQARTFGSFAEVMGDIHQMDSLLYLGSLDDDSFQEIVLELRRQRAEELAAQREAIAQRQAEDTFSGDRFGNQGQRNANQPGASAAGAETGSDGFLYHKNPIQIQENLASFEQRWGERPLVPNWRRIEAVQGIGSGDTREAPGAAAGVDPQLAQEATLPEVDITGVPRDSLSQLAMRSDRARARYELGNVLFLSMGRPDSAAVWYRKIIEEDSDEPVAQRAYYALAEVQRALGDTVSSNRLYELILDQYPTSEFAARSRERLGRTVEVAADSLALAETAYDEAYAIWQRNNYEASLNDMVEIAVSYRDTPVAPRALLAAGKVYLAWADRDSLDLFAPLPLSLPDSLLLEGGLLKVVPKPIPTQVDSAATPTPATPDTLAMPAGNLGAASDSLVVPAGNLVTPSDSLAGESEVDEEKKEVDDGPLFAQKDEVDDAPSQAQKPPRLDSLAAGVPIAPASAPDSLNTPMTAMSDSMGIVADTTALEYEPVRLETLYNTLVSTYPQAPQAAQARRVLTALGERKAAMQARADSIAAAERAPDSTATPAEVLPDSVAAPPATAAREAEAQKGDTEGLVGSMLRDKESRTRPDSARTEEAANRSARLRDMLERRQEEAGGQRSQPADSVDASLPEEEKERPVPADTSAALALPEPTTDEARTDSVEIPIPPAVEEAATSGVDSTVAVESPPAAPSQTGRAPGLTAEERAKGGWAVVVASEGSQREAELRLPLFRTRLETAGYPVDVFATQGEDPPRYRIGLGLFVSQKEAAAALARLAAQLPDDAWVLRVPPAE